ncbi:MAG: rRNA maturation RNase YbeY [Candidatus Paceibacteria bacterium]
MSPFTLIHTTPYPTHPYEAMKDTILGKKYILELSMVGKKRATTINQKSRQKNYAPNVLSFPYTYDHGEIVLCPEVAKKEAGPYGMSYEGYFGFLYIHGLLHLKGYDHGEEMEKLEKKYVAKFKLK